ncbi:purine hydroxylase beta subunit apoprotein [Thermosyntropha lipolytica DSM 11003]|uniref:Purine hydroxylase beta subunit apoprotein n=1 Tax=Thermosyntropha lipolytica DSM 11003 TaxID=1123382 RepID=A0A1M5LD00_9FIRM|nr:molybdopterin cofactor-binding domain-containing protein [Thermosyntropha lipolytica]SHG62931.1 purine hydroxylase beta subunit apoprotein [Thermosyntropha lipolytica DSM 11003]
MKKRGKGIACIFYGTGYGNGFPDVSRAYAELQPDGKVAIYTGATEVGQGAKTALSQIPAEVLGLTVDDIIFINEDTSITPDAGTAAATRQTYNTGNAIKMAAEELKKELINIAVKELGLNSDAGLEMKDGKIYLKILPDKCITLAQIAAKQSEPLRTFATFTAQTVQIDPETGQGAPYWPYTFSACAVEVEVDTETGQVEIIKAAHAQDVGRAINPKMIEGQMEGGFAMAMGYVLYEDLGLENGRIWNNKLSTYIIPTAMDMPEIQNIIVEDPESTAPYGAKGIGEPVMIPVGPAILNAIYDAVGVRMTEIPVTPMKLLQAIREKEKQGA